MDIVKDKTSQGVQRTLLDPLTKTYSLITEVTKPYSLLTSKTVTNPNCTRLAPKMITDITRKIRLVLL